MTKRRTSAFEFKKAVKATLQLLEEPLVRPGYLGLLLVGVALAAALAACGTERRAFVIHGDERPSGATVLVSVVRDYWG